MAAGGVLSVKASWIGYLIGKPDNLLSEVVRGTRKKEGGKKMKDKSKRKGSFMKMFKGKKKRRSKKRLGGDSLASLNISEEDGDVGGRYGKGGNKVVPVETEYVSNYDDYRYRRKGDINGHAHDHRYIDGDRHRDGQRYKNASRQTDGLKYTDTSRQDDGHRYTDVSGHASDHRYTDVNGHADAKVTRSREMVNGNAYVNGGDGKITKGKPKQRNVSATEDVYQRKGILRESKAVPVERKHVTNGIAHGQTMGTNGYVKDESSPQKVTLPNVANGHRPLLNDVHSPYYKEETLQIPLDNKDRRPSLLDWFTRKSQTSINESSPTLEMFQKAKEGYSVTVDDCITGSLDELSYRKRPPDRKHHNGSVNNVYSCDGSTGNLDRSRKEVLDHNAQPMKTKQYRQPSEVAKPSRLEDKQYKEVKSDKIRTSVPSTGSSVVTSKGHGNDKQNRGSRLTRMGSSEESEDYGPENWPMLYEDFLPKTRSTIEIGKEDLQQSPTYREGTKQTKNGHLTSTESVGSHKFDVVQKPLQYEDGPPKTRSILKSGRGYSRESVEVEGNLKNGHLSTEKIDTKSLGSVKMYEKNKGQVRSRHSSAKDLVSCGVTLQKVSLTKTQQPDFYSSRSLHSSAHSLAASDAGMSVSYSDLSEASSDEDRRRGTYKGSQGEVGYEKPYIIDYGSKERQGKSSTMPPNIGDRNHQKTESNGIPRAGTLPSNQSRDLDDTSPRGRGRSRIQRLGSKRGKAYCQKCKKKCSGEVLRVQDNYYHIECFKCKECRNSLASGGFFTKDGEYYCSKDYQDRFGTKCGRCGDYVEGEVVTALGSTYHQTCFRCARCRQPFPAGERVTYTGKEYLCQKCVHIPVVESKTPEQSPGSCRPECAGCQEELKEGQALIALDKQWHIWCFKCHTCNAMLHGEYMGKDGKPYCEKDYQSQFGVKCAYCGRFISGKVLQAGDNHHFHPTCARCTKCGDPFGDGEEMYLQGAAIWHPRCGPGPSENGTIISTGMPNGSIHVNHSGESKEDGLSSTASETQLFRSRTPSLNGSFRSTDTGHSFSRKYVSMRTSSPGLILREYPRDHPPHDDITRIYTYSYLVTEPSMGYLKRPIHPYDKPPRSPQFHRPPPDSVGSTRKHSWGKERAKTAMKALVDSIQTESPRPRSPHMNNEEPIEMAHYPDGARPNPKQPPRIERDDFPAPPFPYTDPERRRRWSGSYKSIPESEEDDTENVDDVPDSARSDDPKLKREEEELTKIASGIGKVFLQQVKEREKIKHWKATHLDPRKASRVPSAAHESVHKLRYDSPINASPSRDLTHQRPWDDGDTDFYRGSSLRSSTGRSIPTVTSYNVVSSLRCAPKPGYGLRASTLPAAGRSGGEISWDGEYPFTGLGREKSQSGEFSSGKSDVSAGSLTDTERGRVSAELRSSTTYSSGLTQTGGFSAHLRQSLPNMVSSSDPPKIYPVHLLMTSNYRLPADVDRMHLERHISDGDFVSIFQIPRVDFYRLPEWKRNDLKRRARLF